MLGEVHINEVRASAGLGMGGFLALADQGEAHAAAFLLSARSGCRAGVDGCIYREGGMHSQFSQRRQTTHRICIVIKACDTKNK